MKKSVLHFVVLVFFAFLKNKDQQNHNHNHSDSILSNRLASIKGGRGFSVFTSGDVIRDNLSDPPGCPVF